MPEEVRFPSFLSWSQDEKIENQSGSQVTPRQRHPNEHLHDKWIWDRMLSTTGVFFFYCFPSWEAAKRKEARTPLDFMISTSSISFQRISYLFSLFLTPIDSRSVSNQLIVMNSGRSEGNWKGEKSTPGIIVEFFYLSFCTTLFLLCLFLVLVKGREALATGSWLIWFPEE